MLSKLSSFEFQLSTPARCPIPTDHSASFLAVIARNQSKKYARLKWKSPWLLVIFNDNELIPGNRRQYIHGCQLDHIRRPSLKVKPSLETWVAMLQPANTLLSRAITMYHEDAEGILVVVDKGDEVRA